MNRRPPGQVRIIGGRLRGSKLPVPELAGLRPSGDRARETLFNWLQHEVGGVRVLDLFAGSGALGFEAVSRGASEAWLIESDPGQARSLVESAGRLKLDNVQVRCADALRCLADDGIGRFGLVYVDPPFAAGLWDAVALALQPRLAARAWVYIEIARAAAFAPPPGWTLHREGQSREVRHLLFRTESAVGAATLGGNSPGAGIVQA